MRYRRGYAPTPEEVRAAREAAGLTREEAAKLIFASARAWQNYEGSEPSYCRPMKPSDFELFLLKTGQLSLEWAISQHAEIASVD